MTRERTKHRCWYLPFYYEPEIPVDYTEHGCEKGAKLKNAEVSNSDIHFIFNATKTMDLKETLSWIAMNKVSFSPSTIVVDTDDGRSLSQYHSCNPQLFIYKRPLNLIRHLNTLLNCANEELAQGGYLWCHCRTANLKKQLLLKKYPKALNWIIYALHYLWHRVIPKLSLTKGIYFAVTKGKNRTYSRVEVLGRMYRAGFGVVDEEFRHGEFFVLAHKVRKPIWDDTPTGSPLIKLRRIGKNGKMIGVYKFRTMYSYSEYLQPYIFEHNHLQEGGKFADDYRINIWGKLFRSLWLDEFPMFINVLKGQMKLVGVRPLSQHYFSLYSPEMQSLRVKVKPGLLPPFYYDKQTPRTIEDVQNSERRYIESYLQHPLRTDWKYFWGTIGNILIHGKRSK